MDVFIAGQCIYSCFGYLFKGFSSLITYTSAAVMPWNHISANHCFGILPKHKIIINEDWESSQNHHKWTLDWCSTACQSWTPCRNSSEHSWTSLRKWGVTESTCLVLWRQRMLLPRSKQQRIKNRIFLEFQWHGVIHLVSVWCLINAELHIETVKPLDCTLAVVAYKWAQPQSAIFQHVNQQTYSCTACVFSPIQFLFSCFQDKGEPDFIVSNVFGQAHHCNAFPFAWPFVTNKKINFSSLGDDQPEVPLFWPEEEAAFMHCNPVQVHLLCIICDEIAGNKFLGQQLQQGVRVDPLLQLVSEISLQADA